MTSGNYFFDNGKSRKFWSYTLDAKKQTIRQGRIGTQGLETTKAFPSASAAEAATTKLVNQKIGKGYIHVDPSKLKFHRGKKWERPATKAQLASLEKRIHAKLPAEYKEFLLTQNGGLPQQGQIGIPGDLKGESYSIGQIYGLYDDPKGYSLLWALDNIQPRLPAGHLPISGWLDFCSISLDRNAGCVYYWDEFAAPRTEFDENRNVIFNSAHGVLVAGSFNEFLTRLAIYQDPDEANDAATGSAIADDHGTTKKEKSTPKSSGSTRKPSDSRGKSRLPRRRQDEILRLTYEGGEELTAAIARGKTEADKHLRKIRREIADFLKACSKKDELDFFAENWNRDGNEKPIHQLIKNPHVDAGTLLRVYWLSCPEDYYLNYRSASEIDEGFDRDVFTTLQRIESRIIKSEYETASIPFDPKTCISMWDRRAEFARQIPDVMYQPITGRKQIRG